MSTIVVKKLSEPYNKTLQGHCKRRRTMSSNINRFVLYILKYKNQNTNDT